MIPQYKCIKDFGAERCLHNTVFICLFIRKIVVHLVYVECYFDIKVLLNRACEESPTRTNRGLQEEQGLTKKPLVNLNISHKGQGKQIKPPEALLLQNRFGTPHFKVLIPFKQAFVYISDKLKTMLWQPLFCFSSHCWSPCWIGATQTDFKRTISFVS